MSGPFDMIFCRNVMIYFKRDLQDQINEIFHSALSSDGFLVYGKTETILGSSACLFERYNIVERVYRKVVPEGNLKNG